ncbi:hypothetical protein MGYG_01040 [Nannizzia gypsea CBS 118893]|uniref:Zn(2)-C6 fungal-type domain-containing protein n=1 Tax=Arthroderma gypseum (strain ATCC MYA-4604 / CBS 118893) TaxID=535722 RepID=E5R3U4_ARTGP|nr:hypothetical protein MGYG_01040 [Nannizzia gypsea CBS 118893]EFQ98004.1 hypothetical protein MGYG_01040 [Nannizzia gypsea CBS 118893]
MPSEGVPKCQRCRRDHKKCSPENRQWPGTKCDRCENYGYECSENLMARRSSQKDMDTSQPVNRLMEAYPHNRFFGCPQEIPRPVPVHPQIPAVGVINQQTHFQSPWAGLFDYLRNVDWLSLTCSPTPMTSNPFFTMFRSSICPVPDISATPLGQRLMYLEAFAQSQRYMQDPSVALSASPLEISINLIATRLQRDFPRITGMFSFDELVSICGTYVRYGSYWNVFRTALQTDEILLVDPAFSFDMDIPKTTFESAQQIWLCPEFGLKQFCQKLSGVSQMISDLARTEQHSEARAFLASKIPDRIEEVLGPRVASSTIHNYPSPFFPPDTMTSSPVELTDGDVYSPSTSAGGDGSEDGYSLDGRGFQPMTESDRYNDACFWGN